MPEVSRQPFSYRDHPAVPDFDDSRALFVFDGSDDGGIPGVQSPLGHRAIGVVYDPRREQWGNWVPSVVPRRYDAFMFLDETRALDPLHMPVLVDGEPPETFPSGM